MNIYTTTGDATIPERVSSEVIFHKIPSKLVLEVSGKGQYENIIWAKNIHVFGTNAAAELSEFVNFFEIFVREPTNSSDYGTYDIYYSGSGGIGTEITVVAHGKYEHTLLVDNN